MSLTEVPLLFVLLGLTAYAVLGGADFGAGVWQLLSAGRRGRALREHAHRSMGPVWEANHVWLIFVLVILWTAYPVAFGSIASTLAVPLFIAAVGIILRGTAYALRSAAQSDREATRIDLAFAMSSILTPFALGTMVGAIASGRVPVGNAAGDLWKSWLNPTAIFIGVLAVAAGAYMAAVFLAADARRIGREDLAQSYRRRALTAGSVTGALALIGLLVMRADARDLFDGLITGPGIAALAASAGAGLATLALLSRSAFEPARYVAAAAVAAIVGGWAVAQQPMLLPGLTVHEAAAGRATLVAILVGVLAGSLVLIPSLALLFRLVLRGAFDPRPKHHRAGAGPRRALTAPGAAWSRIVVTAAAVGTGLALLGGGWREPLGIATLLAAAAVGSAGLVRLALRDQPEVDDLDGTPPVAREPCA
jgi:cytochrome bd ubiquinol oxidase subunit II